MKIDRRAFAASLLALPACNLAACDNDSDGIKEPPPPAGPPQTQAAIRVTPISDVASLKALLDAQVRATGAPSLAAYVFDKQDMLIAAATGVRAVGKPDSVSIGDAWHIGSCAKAMTAALYARLVDAGKAKWGATAAELLPDLAGGMDAAWRTTPVELFLSHRSGLADIAPPWLIARRMDSRPLPEQRTESASIWLKAPPVKPGEFAYSNAGYVVVAAGIERITGKAWEDAMAEHVFGPLGMASAGFGAAAGQAPLGHRKAMGNWTAIAPGPAADNPAAMAPAAGVHVTFDDWAKFARVFFDAAQTFLSADSVKRMTTPAQGADYALGWIVADSAVGGRFIGHTGSNTLAQATVTIQPDAGRAFFVATNCGPPTADEAMRPVERSLMAAVKAGTIL